MIESSNTSSDIISSEKVEGTTVYSTAGDKLGSIDDVMIDKRSGHVRYAVLEFGGFLGVGTDRYPLPWSILKYDTEMDGFTLTLKLTIPVNPGVVNTIRFGIADAGDAQAAEIKARSDHCRSTRPASRC